MFHRKRRTIPFNTSYDVDPKRNYQRLREAIKNNQPIIGRYPLNIQIQTVSACNGECVFCPYQGSWHNKNPGKMSWATYIKIIQDLRAYKIRKFSPYLENEPLLDPSIFEKIRYALRILNPQWVELSTNLSMLNNRKLEEIRKTFSEIPHEIWISFHGVDKVSYENIMGLNFEKSLENVMRLVELSQSVPLNLIIRGSGLPKEDGLDMKSRFEEAEYHSFWDKMLSKFKNKPKISFFRYHDRAGSEQLKEKGMSYNTVFRESLEGFYCVRFDRWLHFLYTGEPILCCMDYNKETSWDVNVRDQSVAEFYMSPIFIDIIKKGIGMIKSDQYFICKKCISPGG